MRTIHRFALLLPLMAACGTGPLDPGPYTLRGEWLGRTFPLEMQLTLEQDGEHNVSGTGELRGLEQVVETVVDPTDPTKLDTVSVDTVVTGTVSFDVEGEWDHPTFELVLTSEGYADGVYDATFQAADSIRGNLRGSGFANATIEIFRQADEP